MSHFQTKPDFLPKLAEIHRTVKDYTLIKTFLFRRPAWFTHEGYWRLAQVLRLGPSGALLLLSLAACAVGLFLKDSTDSLYIGLGYFAGAVAALVGMHLILRLAVWIIDGFNTPKKSS